ncbi:Alpha/Beta hydrolase protein [Stachybotrys elegans]|uniref:Kynurenine formamidase n=1 Tax=Stachybotrys elegans TaxID=80388 RepID=A0A8K0SPJ3_9HYPO|nr:Alpha/Beta hydrolase protein [Stachybotrys elegans]
MADIPGLRYTCSQYGEHQLQRVGVWQFEPSDKQPSGHWIVYIHGGAWRDPRIAHESFVPCIKAILSSADASQLAIRGFASIDYRLSAHPDLPQDPDTPQRELRCARHPDHIQDVRSAIRFLADQHHLSGDYVLVGHSAGATLAYQLLMGEYAIDGAQLAQVPMPAANIGIAGIYDLVGLNERHDGYEGFISAAFGPEQDTWHRTSPARFSGSYKESSDKPLCNLLAWSSEDSLVDEPEIDSMAAKLKKDGFDVMLYKDLKGDHDVFWEEGSQLVRLVSLALQQLQSA